MGMTCEQFWFGELELTYVYKRANDIALQQKSDEMWLQGYYVYEAVGAAVGSIFRNKGTRPPLYREEPIRIIPLTEAEKKAKAEVERKKTIEYFNKLLKKQNAKCQVPSV